MQELVTASEGGENRSCRQQSDTDESERTEEREREVSNLYFQHEFSHRMRPQQLGSGEGLE